MTLHAQLQRFQALQKQERIERAERGSEITQPFHTRLHDVGEVAESFVETYSVIALARLQKLRKSPAIPREAPAVHDHAADRRAVPADELGRRMHHNVRAVLDGP